ncbi:MAG: PAS domain S-box protein [Chitinophagales bacterium]
MIRETGDYRKILDRITLPVVAVSRDWTAIYCNEAYATLIGRTISDIEEHNLLEVVPGLINSPLYHTYLDVMTNHSEKIVEAELGKNQVRERVGSIPDGIVAITEEVVDLDPRTKTPKVRGSGYRDILNAINDAIFICDTRTGEIKDCNEIASEMFGYDRNESLGLNIGDLSAGEPPYTADNVLKWLTRVAGESPQLVEWKTRDKNGRSFWIELRTRPVVFNQQDCILAVMRDISERKQNQKQMRETAERYHELYDYSSELIYSHDLNGNFISINDAVEKVTGFWREELLRMNIEQLVAPEYLDMARDYLEFGRSLAKRGRGKDKVAEYELVIKTKHGNRVMFDVNTWIIYKAGEAVRIQGMAHDITRYQLEINELKEKCHRLEKIIDYLPDPIMAINVEGKVMVWNRAMEELTGVLKEAILGHGDYEYAVPFYGIKRPILVDLVARPDEVEKYYTVSEKDNYVLIGETEAPCLRGIGNYLWGKATPVYARDGTLLGAIESIRDFTEYKRKEEQLEALIVKLEKETIRLRNLLENNFQD